MTEVEMVAGTMQPITNRITAQNFIFDTDNKNALFYEFYVTPRLDGSRVNFQLFRFLANRC